MQLGKIQGLVPDKGFGFIKAQAGGADVFFHCSVANGHFDALTVGQDVQFETVADAEKPKASNVLPVGATPVAAGRRPAGRPGSQGRSSNTAARPPRSYEDGPKRDGSQRDGSQRGAVSREGAKSHDSKSYGTRRPAYGQAAGADKPRGQARPPKDGARSRGTERTAYTPRPAFGRPAVPETPVAYLYGFITRLNRHKSLGFISSVEGGPEFTFEARDVIGLKRYSEIEPGEYVRFEDDPNRLDPKQPKAKAVMVIERSIDSGEKLLARHPKARRKKPTWRGKAPPA